MFDLHTSDTAPAASADRLRQAQAAMGFTPALFRVLAEAPAAYAAYEALNGAFQRDTAFTPLERQVAMMAANRANGCTYCMAAHSMMMSTAKMPAEHIAALRAGTPLADAKLEALRRFTEVLLETRGRVGETRLAAFLNVGYSRAQALELLLGLATKLITNFAASMAELAPDSPAQAFVWRLEPETAAA